MALKIDAKFEGELTYAFKNDMRNLANFAQAKIMNSTFDKTFYTFNRMIILKVSGNFQESCQVRKFSSMFSIYISRTWWLL